MTRRDLARTAAAWAAAAPSSAAPPRQITEELGEPVRLLGTRLAFTGWHRVRPGGFAWVTADGRGNLQAEVGMGDARLRRSDVPWGVRLVTHRGERMGPLLEAEAAWEENTGVKFTTLLKEQGLYRAWSMPTHTSGRPKGQRFFTYFESEDGLRWKRPKLRLYEYNGSRENNILNRSTHDYRNVTAGTPMEFRKPEVYEGTVFLDPGASPAERYKLFAAGNISKEALARYKRDRPGEMDWREEDNVNKEGAKALRGGVSPDGLRWSFLPDALVIEPSDTVQVAYYDQALRKYVAYTRRRNGLRRADGFSPRDSRTTDALRRCIGRSETSDFRRFPVSEVILETAPEHSPAEELYTNCRTAVPGAPDHHLMFPALWSHWDDTTSFPLATSADGLRWQFLPGERVFDTAPFGRWDGGCVFLHPNLTELGDGSWVLPYEGYNVPHKHPRGSIWKFALGYATWRDGRLAGIRADTAGEFATVAIVPPGRTVRVNAVTTRAGVVRVEVAGLDGKPLPGRSFSDCAGVVGDQPRAALTWNGSADLGYKDGQAVFLRFHLEEATVYWLAFD